MLTYYLVILWARLLSLLPLSVLHRLGDVAAWYLERVAHYREKVIDNNLTKSFPEKGKKQIARIKKGFYHNFTDIIAESVKSLSISERTMRKRLVLRNPEVFDQLYEREKGVIMVMGHYTNFEWMAMGIPLLVKQPCFAVYQRLKDPRFNRLVVRIREQFGLKLFQMSSTYPFMLNNPAKAPLYVFMADQSPHKGKIKYKTEFLNRMTPVHLGVENLARKCDLAVAFIEMHRVKRGYYEVEAKLLQEDAGEAERYEITQKHVRALENLIRQKPEDWLWSHKRWKHA